VDTQATRTATPTGTAGPGTAPRGVSPVRPARTLVRWTARHGVAALYLGRSARKGDLVGRLLREPAAREEPYGIYEQLRARGPLVGSSLGPVTTSHALVQDVLRSDRFGVGFDRATLPRVLRWAFEFGDEPDATGPAEPPSGWSPTRPTTPASAGWSAARSPRALLQTLRGFEHLPVALR
jgi:hypothetical protein